MKRILLGILVLILAGAGTFAWTRFQPGGARRLDIQTSTLDRGEIRRVIATSGAVKARVTVEVSTQTSGQIRELPADFNSRVKKGDLLARIDPAGQEAKIRQAEAAVAVADANVALGAAGVEKTAANLAKANNDYERAKALAATGTSSKASLDTAEAARAGAAADVSTAKAQLDNANALAKQRRAELDNAKVDLEHTSIRSPIDGIVIERAIEVGQTVSASSSAPKLFTLAEDLTSVEIGAQVDEADIGQVNEGDLVNFTVDAFPDTTFEGTVAQVRLASTLVSNVVTYTVVIRARNPGEKLLPGMTANVAIITGQRHGVLTVANEALRFQPRGAAAALVRGGASGGGRALASDRPGAPAALSPPADPIAGLQVGLGLDEATMARIRAALPDQVASLSQPGQGALSDPAGQRTRIDRALRDVLTPQQFAQYQQIQAVNDAPPRFGTVWTRDADATLSQHRVRLGLSDVSRTEILAGDIPEGATIVIRAREVTQ